MGCTTFVIEVEPIEIQKNKEIELETNQAVDKIIFDNKLEYTVGLTSNGIIFEESYRSINISNYYATVQEAIALRLIIDKILEFQPDLIFNGEITLSYDCDDEYHKVKIENNIVSTAYSILTFSEFETFNLEKEEELT